MRTDPRPQAPCAADLPRHQLHRIAQLAVEFDDDRRPVALAPAVDPRRRGARRASRRRRATSARIDASVGRHGRVRCKPAADVGRPRCRASTSRRTSRLTRRRSQSASARVSQPRNTTTGRRGNGGRPSSDASCNGPIGRVRVVHVRARVDEHRRRRSISTTGRRAPRTSTPAAAATAPRTGSTGASRRAAAARATSTRRARDSSRRARDPTSRPATPTHGSGATASCRSSRSRALSSITSPRARRAAARRRDHPCRSLVASSDRARDSGFQQGRR